MPKSDLKLLLTPAQRQALKDLAHAQGVREQTIARDAVLSVLGSAPCSRAASPEVISSIASMARQVDKLAREITILLGHCKGEVDGTIERDAEAATRAAKGVITAIGGGASGKNEA